MTRRTPRGQVKSPDISFLNIPSDGRRKKEHNDALAGVLEIFKQAGMTEYNVAHIDDPVRNKNIPLKHKNHVYDLAIRINNGKILLLEVRTVSWPK